MAGIAACLVGCKPETASAPIRSEPTSHPFQEERWFTASINPTDAIRVDKAVDRYRDTEARYVLIGRASDVPSPVIFCLHGRESTWSFKHHLHEGSPLTGRTRWVPKGRPLTGKPPFTFEESAIDALIYDRMGSKNWKSLGDSLQAIERYNGIGYQKYHPETPSPYLWAGTSLYTKGKYVKDGVWDANARDKQLGCAAILKRMKERGIVLPFASASGEPLSQVIRWNKPEKVWNIYPVITATAGEEKGKYVATAEIRGTLKF